MFAKELSTTHVHTTYHTSSVNAKRHGAGQRDNQSSYFGPLGQCHTKAQLFEQTFETRRRVLVSDPKRGSSAIAVDAVHLARSQREGQQVARVQERGTVVADQSTAVIAVLFDVELIFEHSDGARERARRFV